MINIGKELSNIAFQNPTGFGVIFAHNMSILAEFINGPVRAFSVSARIGISDESFVKKWAKNPINRMMQKSVAHCRLVDVSWFWVIDFKGLITAVIVGMIDEVVVERENVIHQLH